jgi:hypothetical protein
MLYPGMREAEDFRKVNNGNKLERIELDPSEA